MAFSFAEMVKGTGKRARQRRNLLLKMSDVRLDGPTLALRQWKDQKHRVKVKIYHNDHNDHNDTLYVFIPFATV